MKDLRQYVGLAVQEEQEQLRVQEPIENTAVVAVTMIVVVDALFFPFLCLYPVLFPFPGPYLSPSPFHGLSLQN